MKDNKTKKGTFFIFKKNSNLLQKRKKLQQLVKTKKIVTYKVKVKSEHSYSNAVFEKFLSNNTESVRINTSKIYK